MIIQRLWILAIALAFSMSFSESKLSAQVFSFTKIKTQKYLKSRDVGAWINHWELKNLKKEDFQLFRNQATELFNYLSTQQEQLLLGTQSSDGNKLWDIYSRAIEVDPVLPTYIISQKNAHVLCISIIESACISHLYEAKRIDDDSEVINQAFDSCANCYISSRDGFPATYGKNSKFTDVLIKAEKYWEDLLNQSSSNYILQSKILSAYLERYEKFNQFFIDFRSHDKFNNLANKLRMRNIDLLIDEIDEFSDNHEYEKANELLKTAYSIGSSIDDDKLLKRQIEIRKSARSFFAKKIRESLAIDQNEEADRYLDEYSSVFPEEDFTKLRNTIANEAQTDRGENLQAKAQSCLLDRNFRCAFSNASEAVQILGESSIAGKIKKTSADTLFTTFMKSGLRMLELGEFEKALRNYDEAIFYAQTIDLPHINAAKTKKDYVLNVQGHAQLAFAEELLNQGLCRDALIECREAAGKIKQELDAKSLEQTAINCAKTEVKIILNDGIGAWNSFNNHLSKKGLEELRSGLLSGSIEMHLASINWEETHRNNPLNYCELMEVDNIVSRAENTDEFSDHDLIIEIEIGNPAIESESKRLHRKFTVFTMMMEPRVVQTHYGPQTRNFFVPISNELRLYRSYKNVSTRVTIRAIDGKTQTTLKEESHLIEKFWSNQYYDPDSPLKKLQLYQTCDPYSAMSLNWGNKETAPKAVNLVSDEISQWIADTLAKKFLHFICTKSS